MHILIRGNGIWLTVAEHIEHANMVACTEHKLKWLLAQSSIWGCSTCIFDRGPHPTFGPWLLRLSMYLLWKISACKINFTNWLSLHNDFRHGCLNVGVTIIVASIERHSELVHSLKATFIMYIYHWPSSVHLLCLAI